MTDTTLVTAAQLADAQTKATAIANSAKIVAPAASFKFLVLLDGTRNIVSGNPLPIGAAVFNLAAKLSKSAELGEIAGTLGTLNSLNGLVKSLERGDEFGALASGAAFVNYFQNTNNKHYQKRSFLLPYSLGYSTKTYLKTTKNCSKRASCKGKNRLRAQKQGNLGRKSSQACLFIDAISYEINSRLRPSR